MTAATKERTVNILSVVGGSSIIAVVLATLVQFGLIGPQRERALLESAERLTRIDSRLGAIETDVARIRADMDKAREGQWRVEDMTVWAHELRYTNSGISVPDPTRVGRSWRDAR